MPKPDYTHDAALLMVTSVVTTAAQMIGPDAAREMLANIRDDLSFWSQVEAFQAAIEQEKARQQAARELMDLCAWPTRKDETQ